MKRTFVILSRTLGNTEQRVNESTPWEMIIPQKDRAGNFILPSNINDYVCGRTFSQYLFKGECVLVSPNGFSWNTMKHGDQIIAIWTKVTN